MELAGAALVFAAAIAGGVGWNRLAKRYYNKRRAQAFAAAIQENPQFETTIADFERLADKVLAHMGLDYIDLTFYRK
jgi:hypothetical protein